MTVKTLHFELSTHSSQANGPLTLHIGPQKFELKAHTEVTLQRAAAENQAIALIPETHRTRLSHYVEVPHIHFPQDRLLRLRVSSPDEDPTIYLPQLHHMSFHIPRTHRERHYSNKFAKNALHVHPKLHSLGVQHIPTNQLVEVNVAADQILTPLDIAKSILFHHPELASNKPYTASIVMNEHIAPSPKLNPDQYNQLHNLALAISKQGQASSKGGWATITDSTDKDGNLLTYTYDFGSHKEGDRILIYKLSDITAQASAAPLSGAMQSANDDPALQNQTWRVNQGFTAHQKDNGAPSQSLLRADSMTAKIDSPVFKWTVKEQTPHHGLNVDTDTLSFSADNTFSINVENNYLRTLTAYAQFFNENGDAIQNPSGWNEQLPNFLRHMETDSKKYISSISAINVILGIPMPTDPTTLSFPFPSDATSLKLLFGCLGTSNWDGDVDPSGAILTGIFQYGIPSLFLVAGAAIDNSSWFSEFVKDTDNVVAAIAVAFPIVGGGVTTAAALLNTKAVLSFCADAIGGILLAKGLEKLALYVTEKITVAEMEDEVPFVGWVLRVANIVIGIAEMAETTGELLSSPATLEIDITRAMNLNLTLKPDPAHGEAGNPDSAVWPALSDHYQMTVQYQGGTNFVLKGQMPDVTSSTPLNLTFSDLPVGGKIQIIAGIYAANGWLCGKWQSDWLDAFPDAGTITKSVSDHITEILVPLTQDTQYEYKEKIAYDHDTNLHHWHAGDLPTETIENLDCSGAGTSICKLVDITLNGPEFQVGYAWSAAGENYVMQNLSVLAKPESRLKFSEVQFQVQPYIAYDQYGQSPQTESGDDAGDSQTNFILDTRNNQFHLRQVNLTDGKSGFGLDDSNLRSWGQFNLPNLDAIVVHPNRAVIAVSWKDSKMEILQLPTTPSDDANAPQAQMISGRGVRQGLLQGPAAIAVAPDGRVLILETLNQRVQSFDTKGNPVPSFLGEVLFKLDAATYTSDLDAGTFSAALQQQFQDHGLTHLFDVAPGSMMAALNSATLSDNVISALANNGIYLSYDSANMSDHTISSYVTVITAGSTWTVTDPTRNAAYTVQLNNGELSVYDVLTNVLVDVRCAGRAWVVQDLFGAESYYIAVDGTDSATLHVNRYLSYMPLYNPENRTDITYLDIAVEAKGYLYVLSFVGNGQVPSDYILDIYQPDGTFLVRTPDERLQPSHPQYVSAAKLVVDIWRNVYTLNYEAIQGPNGRNEPSISHWMPTPPLFDLDVSKQVDFAKGNISAIIGNFQANNVKLSTGTQVKSVSDNGFWQVMDGTQTYDVIRSGAKLEVYAVPVAQKA